MFMEEYQQIHDTLTASIRPVELPDAPTNLFNATHQPLDVRQLVALRRQHQTRQAEDGIRTRGEATKEKPEVSMRRQLIREFHAVLKEEQDLAVGTGCERNARWRASAPGGRLGEAAGALAAQSANGNSANAAAAAAAIAKQVRTVFHSHVTKIFTFDSLQGGYKTPPGFCSRKSTFAQPRLRCSSLSVTAPPGL